MTAYRIVCTEQEPVTQPTTHAHIVAAGTGDDPNRATKRWTLNEIISAMNQGHSFYTRGLTSGKVAQVEKYTCPRCHRTHIRSTADRVLDNNLDNLRRCSWSS